MTSKIIWSTPDADHLLAFIARVSNPENQDNQSIEGLLKYMAREGHNSPFEMVHACFEVNTTRDIARQMLRHRSFSFQEFSQRYAAVTSLSTASLREARLQDNKNRQNSLEVDDEALRSWCYRPSAKWIAWLKSPTARPWRRALLRRWPELFSLRV